MNEWRVTRVIQNGDRGAKNKRCQKVVKIKEKIVRIIIQLGRFDLIDVEVKNSGEDDRDEDAEVGDAIGDDELLDDGHRRRVSNRGAFHVLANFEQFDAKIGANVEDETEEENREKLKVEFWRIRQIVLVEADANFNLDGFSSGKEEVGDLRYEAGRDDSDVDENSPELVLKIEWIVEDEDGEVPDDDEGIVKQNDLNERCVLEDKVEVAEPNRIWTDDVSQCFRCLDKDEPDDDAAARRGDHSIDENSSEVRSVVLVPDDPVERRNVQDDQHERRTNAGHDQSFVMLCCHFDFVMRHF